MTRIGERGHLHKLGVEKPHFKWNGWQRSPKLIWSFPVREKSVKTVFRLLAGLALSVFSIYFLLLPSFTVFNEVRENRSQEKPVSDLAFAVHRAIATDFATWARERVDGAAGASLNMHNISGTEWPMFSAVYFLWATEELDKAWMAREHPEDPRPKDDAADAIEAAVTLIVDPANASWVKRHWGDAYLETENVFYRMLLIAGLTSYQTITGNDRHEPLLRQQVVSLARELDQSPHGVLDDYPGECYPIDILPAIAVMQRAGDLLNIDLGDFVARSRRGFEGALLDTETRLPSYRADPLQGVGLGPARGVGISYMLIWAPELWPGTASDWYALYDQHFVEKGTLISGVREFHKGVEGVSWLGDVDSGPILAGYGVAASAFGAAAARIHGDTELEHALMSQAILAAWPLPSGRLLVPSLLSDLSDAPFLGESALLFVLTRPGPDADHEVLPDTPMLVYLVLAATVVVGFLLLFWGLRLLFRTGRMARAASSVRQ